jgi:CxxC motif-containing protein
LSVTVSDGELAGVRGNRCKKGVDYATNEILDPRRILTTTVSVRGGTLPQLPVRTREAIPKGLISEGMRRLSRCVVDAPVHLGDVVVPNFLGTGIDVIASRSISAVNEVAAVCPDAADRTAV